MKLHWPSADSIEGLSDHQRSIVAATLAKGPIAIIGGSPGTGKTFTAAAVIKAIASENPIWSIAVAGPTGKSAVRITEAMQQYGISLQAKTIHRLLRVRRSGHDGKGWGFEHGPDNPLTCKFLFITEASMIDTDLAASLFSAIESGTHILIEGDISQLPPVGHGAPLRDMIAAGIPYGELTEIRRNSGTIVHACRDIKLGRNWEPSQSVDVDLGMNLLHVESPTPVIAIEQLKRMLVSVPAGVDPIWDCQVLCQVNEKSDLSRVKLNRLLQGWLNPHGRRAEGNPYRLGDKVICTTNTELELVPDEPARSHRINPTPANVGRLRSWSDGRDFVANGEIGRVVHVEPKLFHVRFDNPQRTVKVPLAGKKANTQDAGSRGDDEHAGAACDFAPGYCISTHKSQGSQWKIVFVMIDSYPGASMVASRELLYTAISRAQVLCVTIGRKCTADQWCRKVVLPKRKTFLASQLREQLTNQPVTIQRAGI